MILSCACARGLVNRIAVDRGSDRIGTLGDAWREVTSVACTAPSAATSTARPTQLRTLVRSPGCNPFASGSTSLPFPRSASSRTCQLELAASAARSTRIRGSAGLPFPPPHLHLPLRPEVRPVHHVLRIRSPLSTPAHIPPSRFPQSMLPLASLKP